MRRFNQPHRRRGADIVSPQNERATPGSDAKPAAGTLGDQAGQDWRRDYAVLRFGPLSYRARGVGCHHLGQPGAGLCLAFLEQAARSTRPGTRARRRLHAERRIGRLGCRLSDGSRRPRSRGRHRARWPEHQRLQVRRVTRTPRRQCGASGRHPMTASMKK
jgi:hypothetical protein